MAENWAEHTLVLYRGTLGDVQEWSMGVRMDITEANWVGFVAGGGDPVNDFLVPMAQAFTDNFAQELFSDFFHFTSMKASIILNDGSIAAPPYHLLLATPYNGSSSVRHPFQDAAVVTWKHVGIGRGNYGRVYLPAIAQAPAGDGRWTEAYAEARWPNAFGWLSDMAAAGAGVAGGTYPEGAVQIYSRAHATKKTIDRVGFGRVPDTQRRRRNDLVEEIFYGS